jgi:hypothetical protein
LLQVAHQAPLHQWPSTIRDFVTATERILGLCMKRRAAAISPAPMSLHRIMLLKVLWSG